MGVVIGETTEIGDFVTLFQGVTLGGTGKERGKRHSTLGNHIVVGAGAKVLVGNPERIVKYEENRLPEATMDHTNIPDPIAERFESMEQELIVLRKKVERTE